MANRNRNRNRNGGLRNALRNVGRNLGPRELGRLEDRFGSGRIRQTARNLGINIRGNNSLPGFELPGFGEGFAPAEFDFQSTIGAIREQGGIDRSIAELNANAAQTVERIRGNNAARVANIEAGATRYVADRNLESALGVENIRAKGAIDLQGVVNAGLENVENIRGEYGLKGKMLDRGTSIYAGLVNAFNFS